MELPPPATPVMLEAVTMGTWGFTPGDSIGASQDELRPDVDHRRDGPPRSTGPPQLMREGGKFGESLRQPPECSPGPRPSLARGTASAEGRFCSGRSVRRRRLGREAARSMAELPDFVGNPTGARARTTAA